MRKIVNKKEERRFTTGSSLNQLTDKVIMKTLLSCAKIQNIFVICKQFHKKPADAGYVIGLMNIIKILCKGNENNCYMQIYCI